MTTTITIETHSWPVRVETNSYHNHDADDVVSNGYSSETRFVPKGTKHTCHISQTSSINISELHPDATSLRHHTELTTVSDKPQAEGMLSGGATTIVDPVEF